MRSRRVILALVLLATVGAVVWSSRSANSGSASARLDCLGDRENFRWPVKTLSDPAALSVRLRPKLTTVARLRALPAPPIDADTPRIKGVETTTYRVTAPFDHLDLQKDQDIHLVIKDRRDPSQMMLVEFPDIRCPAAARSPRRRLIQKARAAFIKACGRPTDAITPLRGSAVITGVGFFDDHRQFAANGIELHPVLGFRNIRCRRA